MGIRNVLDASSNNFTANEKTMDKFKEKHSSLCLLDNEDILFCLEQLSRDYLVVTNKRILVIDAQGASGKKVSYDYINLSKLCYVGLETGGLGFDDVDLILHFVQDPIISSRSTVVERQFDISKKYEVAPLYQYLLNLANSNEEKWNNLDK